MEGERYLIAGDVILAWPEIVASRPVGAELLIAEDTLRNLRTTVELGFASHHVLDLVTEAVNRGILKVVSDIPSPQVAGWYRGPTESEPWWDETLARIASAAGAVIASDEPLQRKMAAENSIPVISGIELRRRVQSPPPIEQLSIAAQGIRSALRRHATLSFVAAVAATLMVAGVFRVAIYSARMPRPWWLAGAAAVTGFALFVMRSKLRVAYGSVEVLAGILTAWNVALRDNVDVSSVSVALQFLAAVYIVVRGLDNIVTGWPDSPLRFQWRRFVGPYRTA